MNVIASCRDRAGFCHASRSVALCLGLSIFFFGRTHARAEDAAELVKRGIELRRTSKDADALAEFKKAWAIEKQPRIEAQMALAEQALGLWVNAEEHLLEALTHVKTDSWTQKNRATLTSALTVIQRHLGTLDVWGTPSGAAVFVNEKSIGTLPLGHPVRIADESVVVRLRADGFLEWSQMVRVEPSQSVRQHVEMIPSAPARAPIQPPVTATRGDRSRAESRVSPPAKEEAVTSVVAQSPEPPPPPEASTDPGATDPRASDPPSRRELRPYAWAAGAAAVLGAGLGVVESFVAINRRNQFNSQPECGTSSLTDTCRSIQGSHDRAATLATVGYVSGGGLAVLSAVLFILSSAGNEDPTSSVARACIGDVALRGVACVFSF